MKLEKKEKNEKNNYFTHFFSTHPICLGRCWRRGLWNGEYDVWKFWLWAYDIWMGIQSFSLSRPYTLNYLAYETNTKEINGS